MAAEPSFNEGLALTVDRALRHLDLPPGLPEQIKACDSVLQVHFPVRLDDGGSTSSAAGAPRTARICCRPRAASATPPASTRTRWRRWLG